MEGRRPRVALRITPRLLQDTLSMALSEHADVVDLLAWRERDAAVDLEGTAFDVAVVSGGLLPETIDAGVVIDIDGGDGVPSLHAIQERVRAVSTER